MQNQNSRSTLSEVPAGTSTVIAGLSEGNEINRRLTSMGFTPGAGIEIVQNYGHGPMIVSVRGMRVALGRGEAEKISVHKEK